MRESIRSFIYAIYTFEFARSQQLVLSLCVLCVLCVLCGEFFAQDFKQTHPGVEHAQVEYKIGEDPVKINLLRLDLKKVRLDVHHALDKAIGLETTSSIANRKGAIAAINAGFFRFDRSDFAGDAAGIFMIDGDILSESVNGRTALVISNEKKFGSIFFNRMNTESYVQVGPQGRITQFSISGINRERKVDEVVLYTPHFGRSIAQTDGGSFVILGRCKAGKLAGSFRNISCLDTELVHSIAGRTIPASGLIISIGNEVKGESESLRQRIVELVQTRKAKKNIQIRHVIMMNGGQYTTDGNVDITNGASRLIKDGKIDITWEQEKASRAFVFNRHPRTAVAKMKDNKFLMMTVDGRQPGVSVGMTLPELADYLLALGAVDAMNLDGGGSTTMVLDGKVVNKPSDPNGERKIGDAILVTPRKK